MPPLSDLAAWAQIVSLPVAIIAVGFSFWLYRRGKLRRDLGCDISPVSSPIVIDASEEFSRDLEIRYQGKDVTNLFTAQSRLKVTGNLPIRKSHVVEPVTFCFGPKAHLLGKRIVNQFPNEFEVKLVFTQPDPNYRRNSVYLDFELLNEGDELWIEFVWIGDETKPKVNARIEGVGEITSIRERSFFRPSSLVFLFGVLAFLSLSSIVWLPGDEKTRYYILGVFFGVATTAILSFILNQLAARKKAQSRWYW